MVSPLAVSWFTPTVGRMTVASEPWPLISTSQVVSVSSPLKVMVPVEAAWAENAARAKTAKIEVLTTDFFIKLSLIDYFWFYMISTKYIATAS